MSFLVIACGGESPTARRGIPFLGVGGSKLSVRCRPSTSALNATKDSATSGMQTHSLIVADNGRDLYVRGGPWAIAGNEELNPAFRT